MIDRRRAAGSGGSGEVRRTSPLGTERGSGSIWTLAVAAVLILAGLVSVTIVAVMSAGRRADTAADLAALSAAAGGPAAMDGACSVAARIAAAHQARLISCTLTGAVVDVVVEVRPRTLAGDLLTMRARAKAGPTSEWGRARHDMGAWSRAPP
ncbi:Rv3654c family TadE-like protein [Actinopolymorpha alba]|uniref:Rv3654c family TadE-like protein n=1 Tax=Actinopolymorpha alba TaxID=533267 RepID=UPI00037538C9|nr:Rv3654c family TadE-like protein [Actinopolymorpha alba]